MVFNYPFSTDGKHHLALVREFYDLQSDLVEILRAIYNVLRKTIFCPCRFAHLLAPAAVSMEKESSVEIIAAFLMP